MWFRSFNSLDNRTLFRGRAFVATFVLGALLFFVGVASGQEQKGSESGGAKESAPKVSKEAIEFYKKESRINSLKSKIEEGSKQFKRLVEEKNRSQDKDKRTKLSEQMGILGKDINQWIREYNALRIEVKYKYPSRGDSIERRYTPMREQSLEEMETPSFLDEQLTETQKKVEAKYKSLGSGEETEGPIRPETPQPTSPNKQPKLKLVK